MVLLLLCLLTLECPASAKSARTVRLADGDMEQIFVEPGFSTLLKFSSHPEPGLIGDQDGFKVEYMKNIVAIKPLVSNGKTNLFIFTKDGQFNFQLIAVKGRHDNVVYVEPRIDRFGDQPSTARVAVPVDDLLTRRLNKVSVFKDLRLCLESISTPVSHTTLVLKFSFQIKLPEKSSGFKIDPNWFSVAQGSRSIKIENIFLESKALSKSIIQTTGLILIRSADFKKGEDLRLAYSPAIVDGKSKLQVTFSPELLASRAGQR